MTVLNGHVVVCLFADADSPLIGINEMTFINLDMLRSNDAIANKIVKKKHNHGNANSQCSSRLSCSFMSSSIRVKGKRMSLVIDLHTFKAVLEFFEKTRLEQFFF